MSDNNSFPGGAKGRQEDDGVISEGGEDIAQQHQQAALMRADLEISPLVTSVPPMPGDASGPSFPRSDAAAPTATTTATATATTRLAPKKQKLNDGAAAVLPTSELTRQQPAGDTALPSDLPPKPTEKGTTVTEEAKSATEDTTVAKEGTSAKPPPTDKSANEEPEGDDKTKAESNKSAKAAKEVAKAPASPKGSDAAKTAGAAPSTPGRDQDHRRDLMAIVTGTKSPVTPKADEKAAEKEAPKGEADKTPSTGTEPPKSSGKRVRKKAPKPIRRVMIGRKERDLAEKLLKGKKDLLDYLPKEDCFFLGERLWIFTTEHLLSLLDPVDSSDPEGAEEKKVKELRKELVEELGRRYQLKNDEAAAGDKAAESRDPKTETTQPEAMEIEETEEPSTAEKETPPTTEKDEKTGNTTQAADATKDEVKMTTPGQVRNPFNIPKLPEPNPGNPLIPPGVAFTPFLVPSQKTARVDDVLPLSENVQEPEEEAVPVEEKYLEVAEAKLKEWKGLLQKAVESKEESVPEKQFPLNGPISCLIPKSAQNFLSTTKVSSVYQFLCLRRTETGAICDLLRVWREQLNLKYLNHLALAKHLLGISFRMEKSLSSALPFDKRTRRWMRDSIIVMTGAARDFLVDHLDILTVKRFLTTRTKDLSTKLAEWREQKGLVPLKGSGKVAMVSGWKACAREERDAIADDGKVITGVDLKEISARETPIIDDEGRPEPAAKSPAPPKPAAKKPKPKQPNLQLDYASHSQLFVEHVLGKEVASLLSSADIHTAADLEKAETEADSVLCQRMMERKMADDLSGCQDMVEKWRKELQENLKDMSKEVASKKTPPPHKSPSASTPISGNKRTPRYIHFADPYDALSAVTKVFLGTIGITTGREFLSTRTTDISNEFVKWREREGKAELKGLGAIASVSGWKAQCRKAAADMGLHDIATLEPESSKPVSSGGAAIYRKPTPKPPTTKTPAPSLPLHDSALLSREDDLAGKARLEFAVQKSQGSYGQFVFEISARRKEAKGLPGIFLTFKGASPIASARRAAELSDSASPLSCIEILEDVPLAKRQSSIYGQFDFRAPFASSSPGCGLVELSLYGVVPLEKQDLEGLKRAIRYFIFERAGDAPSGPFDTEQTYNVIVHRGEASTLQYFLHVPSPLERGQTLQLRFPTIRTVLSLNHSRTTDSCHRLAVDEALGVLCQDDLRSILSWLNGSVFDQIKDLKKPEDQQVESVQQTCVHRRRLHWLYSRALALIKTPSETDKEAEKSIFFGRLLIDNGGVEGIPSAELSRSLSEQVKEELVASLENDLTCGRPMRTNWCKIAQDMFQGFIDLLASSVAFKDEEIEDEFPDKVKGVFSPFFDLEKDTKLEDLCTERQVAEAQERDGPPTGGTEKTGAIACDDRSTRSEARVVFKSLESLAGSKGEVSYHWYRGVLWSIASSVLEAFESILDESDRPKFKIDEVIASLEKSALEVDKDLTVYMNTPRLGFVPERLRGSGGGSENTPVSYQFFLGVVWPALRDQGWRLDAGDSPSDVVFFPPKVSRRKRASQAKKEGTKKRLRLAREVDKLGWGSVRKLTQRVVVAVAPEDESSKPPRKSSCSVIKMIGHHLDWILEELNDEGTFCSERAGLISDAIRDCFDAVAPFMAEGARWPALPKATGKPSSTYGAEALIQMLLVLPSILRQSSLPLQEINDSLQIVQDLVDFFTKDYDKLLEKRFRPPEENYLGELAPKFSNLSIRLKLLKPTPAPEGSDGKDGTSDELTEALLVTDKLGPDGEKILTDFVIVVMEQCVPCRATEMDAEKKFRRIHVGFPGLACRHCLGKAGEGRYFFSTLESLTTASTVLEKHLLKCSSVPPNIRSEVVSTKITHPGQRKTMETGSQQAYFNRLWDRLRSSKFGGPALSSLVSRSNKEDDGTTASSQKLQDDSDSLEFRNHVVLLDFVRTTPPWKNNKSIQGALSKYYSCLDYGGRIYQTPSMPKHFSPEWLLGKVVPKRYEYAKAKYLPG